MSEDKDYGIDVDDWEYASDHEKQQYNERYNRILTKKLEGIEDMALRGDTFDVLMNNIQYKPTGNARNDAELVMAKARDHMNQAEKNIDPAIDSLAAHIAKSDGLSKKEVLRKYRKEMQNDDNARLNKPGFY